MASYHAVSMTIDVDCAPRHRFPLIRDTKASASNAQQSRLPLVLSAVRRRVPRAGASMMRLIIIEATSFTRAGRGGTLPNLLRPIDGHLIRVMRLQRTACNLSSRMTNAPPKSASPRGVLPLIPHHAFLKSASLNFNYAFSSTPDLTSRVALREVGYERKKFSTATHARPPPLPFVCFRRFSMALSNAIIDYASSRHQLNATRARGATRGESIRLTRAGIPRFAPLSKAGARRQRYGRI